MTFRSNLTEGAVMDEQLLSALNYIPVADLDRADWISVGMALKESGFDMNEVFVFDTVREALAFVYQTTTPEDTILLENDLPDAFNN